MSSADPDSLMPSSPEASSADNMSTTAPKPTLSPPFANANGKRPLRTISDGNGNGHDDNSTDPPSHNGNERKPSPPTASASAGAPPGKNAKGASVTEKTFVPMRGSHEASGYMWTRAEEAPGWAWTNRKARDEMRRALEGMVHLKGAVQGECLSGCRDGEVVANRVAVDLGRYGGPFEAVERERALGL